MSVCQYGEKGECTAEAIYGLKISVPAKGWPIEMHTPQSVILGFPLCPFHVQSVKVEDFMSSTLRTMFEMVLRGKCPPDFDRAFIEKIYLTSEEYLQFERMQHSRQ